MIIKKLCATLSILPVLLFTSVHGVVALEIEISGNSGGSNEVAVTSQTTSEVTQTNTATVNNNVTVDANTGNNTTSNNSGDTTIATGNVEINVAVENSLNTSTAEAGCCNGNTNSVTISDNSGGSNTVVIDSSSTTSLSINQIASIHNNVQGTSNTGGNSANNNGGSVTIQTGNITQEDVIINKYVNVVEAKLYAQDPSWNIKISGNSSDKNTVILTLRNDVITSIYGNADIRNVSLWDLTTGNNSTDKNNGEVTIVTGSIYSTSSIKNDGINVSSAEVECCKKEEVDPPTPPTPPVPPTNNGGNGGSGDKVNNGGSSSGSGGSSGSSLGSILGAILPATGASFWLFATIANILMFLLGLYLRLKAGRSPCFAYANR